MTIEINNVDELQAMKDNLTEDYILAKDIDASATLGWNGDEGFIPIGTDGDPFTGTFDGQNYTITGLRINRPSDHWQGLFGLVEGVSSFLKNVKFADCSVVGSSCAGILAGRINEVIELSEVHTDEDCFVSGKERTGGLFGEFISLITISNCSTAGTVGITSDGAGVSAGGIVGYFPSGDFLNCHSSANVTGGFKVGGFAGDCCSTDSTCTNCYATGNVVGTSYAGGFVGLLQATCKKCYATGDVSALPNVEGNTNVGGFVGHDNSYLIEDCYATGNVQAYQYAGGFFASSGSVNQIIKRCYSTGRPSGTLDMGGFGVDNKGTVEDCFWDTITSEIETSDGGTGKTTEEMYQEETFTNWDFSSPIWYIQEGAGYPTLEEVEMAIKDDIFFTKRRPDNQEVIGQDQLIIYGPESENQLLIGDVVDLDVDNLVNT